jgi:hypothetical protein
MRCAAPLCNVLVALGFLAAGPVGAGAQTPKTTNQKYPEVVAVKIRPRTADSFDFDVTVSSLYDGPSRYADGFRVAGKDGQVYAERKLLHDHAGEQPFTRDLYGVTIPRGVRTVVIQARDQVYGYGGGTVEAALPGREAR